jgi:hypothetical protein
MTIETDTLNVLKAIQKQLDASSKTMGGMGGGRGAITSDKIKSEREKTYQKTIVTTSKKLDNFGQALDTSRDHVKKFTDGIKSGRTGVGNLTTSFQNTSKVFTTGKDNINRAMGSIGKGLGNLDGNIIRSASGLGELESRLRSFNSSAGLAELQNALTIASTTLSQTQPVHVNLAGLTNSVGHFKKMLDKRVNPGLNSLNTYTSNVSSAFAGLIISLKTQATKPIGAVRLARQMKVLHDKLAGPAGSTGLIQQVGRATKFVRAFATALGTGRRGGGGNSGGGNNTGNSASNASQKADDTERTSILRNWLMSPINLMRGTAAAATAAIGRNIIEIVNDAFQVVTARGLGLSTGTMFELYTNAALAGMSLAEYTKVIDDNVGVFTRFKNFEEFDNQLAKGRDGLRAYGIAGLEATNLTAAMMSSASSLGIPMSEMGESVKTQTELFGRLQKASLMTAEAFQEIVVELGQNEIVQKELLGLQGQERQARLNQIAETATWGKSLGMTDAAARKLTDAFLGMRKSTVKERFQASGRVRQAFAIAGMSGADQERGAELFRKRNKTTAEEQELAGLMGDFKSRAEAIKASGDIGSANQIEMAEANLDQTIAGPLNEAVVQLKLLQDSGKQQNKETGQKLTNIDMSLIRIGDYIEGLAKSPLFMIGFAGALAGVAALASVVWQNSLAAKIGAAVRGAMPSTSGTGVDATTDKGKGKGKGRLSRFGPRALAGVAGAGIAAYQFMNAEATPEQSKTEAKGSALGLGLGAILGGVIGSIVPVAGTAMGAAAGMAISAALAGTLGFFGEKVGGFFGQIFESKEEKNARWAKEQKERDDKQAEELKKNSAATKDNTEQLKAQNAMPTDVISRSNLDGLSANLARTAAAARMIIGPIATPTQQTPSTPNPASVNTPEASEKKTSKSAEVAAAVAALPPQEQNAVLMKILQVLEQSLTAETAQAEALQRLVVANSAASKLPNQQAMVDKVRYGA